MELIFEIERVLDILCSREEILFFTSYDAGLQILRKRKILI